MKPKLGLFIAGTDTDVGKTYVTSLIAKSLVAAGHRVGVYKPVASGCSRVDGQLQADDAVAIWEAAGRPRSLNDVCPQAFEAPLAPQLAARAEGREIDEDLLFKGADVWGDDCDILLVEGVGGLMSPITDNLFVADIALELGYPILVVAANRIGVINQTLQTVITAATFRDGLPTAGIILNDVQQPSDVDPSSNSNREQLELHCVPPLLSHVAYRDKQIDAAVDWMEIAKAELEV
ncbi:MAG: dethiobiotin synthetase [Pirellulaceae bacterium]|jgi:dethiobiotin synthetase